VERPEKRKNRKKNISPASNETINLGTKAQKRHHIFLSALRAQGGEKSLGNDKRGTLGKKEGDTRNHPDLGPFRTIAARKGVQSNEMQKEAQEGKKQQRVSKKKLGIGKARTTPKLVHTRGSHDQIFKLGKEG